MKGAKKLTTVIIILTWCCCILGVQLARTEVSHSQVGGNNDGRSSSKREEKGGGGKEKSESLSAGKLVAEEDDDSLLETLQRTRRDRSSSVLQSETNGGHNVVLDQDIDDEALGIFDEKRRDLDKSSPRINRTDDQENDLDAEDSSRRINNNGGAPRSTEVVDDMFKLSESSGVVGGGGGDNDNEGALEPVTVVPPIESVLATKGDQDEKILLQYLMRGYERDVRPVRNSSQPVVIEVGITLTQIFDMDEKNQVLTTNVWLDQEWYDELLRWDPVEFNGLESIRLPCERIWLPDVVLYNNADDYTQGYMPSRAMVSHDGKVFWPPPTKFRSTCPVDVTYFPFDDQICTLKLGSWTYNGFQVDVMNRTADVDLSNYVQNGEWELLEARLERNVVYYSCCPEPFPDVTITLIIRRKTLYYIYNIVLPCVMLSALTLLVFCLPPDSGEKIALGVTVLLAFSVFMLAIAEKMPETSESIPLIGIYLTAVMAITSVSVIVTVVVLNLHYLGPQVKPVPPCLRRFLPKDRQRFVQEISRIRQKSWLIPPTHREPRSGSLKRSLVMLPPNRLSIDSYTGQPINNTRGNGDHHYHQYHHHPLEGMDMIKKPLKECSSTESMTNENAAAAATTTATGNFTTPGGKSSRSSINYHLHTSSLHNTTTTPSSVGSSTLHQRHGSRHPRGHSTTENIPTVSDSSVDISTPAVTPVPIMTGGNGGGGSDGVGGGDIQEELLRSIRQLIGKQEEIEAQNLMVAEWRLVAQAIDRILFWIFTTVTLVSSAVFLLILPIYKRSWHGPNPPSSSTQ